MRDVAELAGVSVKTVSNVVREWPYVAPETRKRVQNALEALGYRMNLSARTLRSGRSGIIALAVPWLDAPYFAELTAELARQADALGWSILVDQTEADPDRERQVVEGFSGRLIDGLIYSPSALSSMDIARLRPQKAPMVLLGERVPHHAGDLVSIDYVAASQRMTEHLLKIDKRVAAVGIQRAPTEDASRLRVAGFDEALRRVGLDPAGVPHVTVDELTRAEGARAMHELLALPEPPKAVFCFNDLLALGACHAARQMGLAIPADIAIAGFDDIDEAAFAAPPLTSVRPDRAAIASATLDFLQRRLEPTDAEADLAPRRSTPGFDLVVRGSTIRP